MRNLVIMEETTDHVEMLPYIGSTSDRLVRLATVKACREVNMLPGSVVYYGTEESNEITWFGMMVIS